MQRARDLRHVRGQIDLRSRFENIRLPNECILHAVARNVKTCAAKIRQGVCSIRNEQHS